MKVLGYDTSKLDLATIEKNCRRFATNRILAEELANSGKEYDTEKDEV